MGDGHSALMVAISWWQLTENIVNIIFIVLSVVAAANQPTNESHAMTTHANTKSFVLVDNTA